MRVDGLIRREKGERDAIDLPNEVSRGLMRTGRPRMAAGTPPAPLLWQSPNTLLQRDRGRTSHVASSQLPVEKTTNSFFIVIGYLQLEGMPTFFIYLLPSFTFTHTYVVYSVSIAMLQKIDFEMCFFQY